jgi:hypothetical protein
MLLRLWICVGLVIIFRAVTWLKSKNPASEAVRREREEEWRY